MAEIQAGTLSDKKHGIRSKKLSTRVDLTPMVDLGFLLITFFIFTTTLSQPQVMKLNLPKEEGPDMLIPEGKTLTLLLCKDNTIGYYSGNNTSGLQYTNFSAEGIRTIIQQHQQNVKNVYKKDNQEFVIIKPTTDASYKNVVDVLDEMLINNVKSYVLADETTEDTELLSIK